jgi:hypothetical protein
MPDSSIGYNSETPIFFAIWGVFCPKNDSQPGSGQDSDQYYAREEKNPFPAVEQATHGAETATIGPPYRPGISIVKRWREQKKATGST